MSTAKGSKTILALVFAGAATLLGGTPAAASVTPAPAWAPFAVTGPTNLPPEGKGAIAIYAQNIGGLPSSGTVTIKDQLPPGLVTAKTPSGEGWSCAPAGAGQSAFTCTSAEAAGPGLPLKPIRVALSTGSATVTPETNLVTVSGGGAANPASYEGPVTISLTPAKPGVQVFSAGSYDADGTPNHQSGSHPYSAISDVFANTVLAPNGDIVPAGDPKTIRVALPPGFLGNPTATPRCPEGRRDIECPHASQVGLAKAIYGSFGANGESEAVHSVEAPFGYPAKFTFSIATGEQINVVAFLRSDEDYGVGAESPNTPQIEPVYAAFFVLWGSPADHGHDGERCEYVDSHIGCGPSEGEETAFVTQPTDCALQAEAPPLVSLEFDTWQTTGIFDYQTFPIPPVTGCDQLHLNASFAFEPVEEHQAATPAAFNSQLFVPQEGLTDPETLLTPELRTSTITLPRGVMLNPSSADGLETCSTKQIGLRGIGFPLPNRIRFNKESAHCPDGSKIGTVEVVSPLLDNPLHGAFYLAAQGDNPFGNLLAGYLVIDDPSVGIIVKLPGKIEPDPVTGQLKAIFDDNPQLPFSALSLRFKGGERSALATPDTCGTFTTKAQFTPWSAPESGPDTISEESFQITEGPNGAPCANTKADRPFHPSFSAGTASTSADAYSPFELRVTRKDGEQELKGISFTMPPGLTGKVAGIGRCSDTEIALAEQKSGKEEQQSPSCPASSEVGTVTTASGIGGSPIYVKGKVYLGGPYQGGPASAVAVVPAVAGPYDLGTVVMRAPLRLDPVTAQLTVDTEGIPDLLQGIPVAIRSVKVDVDRKDFIVNPTSCEKMSIEAKLTGAGADTATTADDTTASISSPFQVRGCENLGFGPKFAAKLKGGTKRGDFPAFSTTLAFPEGQGYANTKFVQVTLPRSEFLEQGHFRTVCTRVQFAEGGGNGEMCPPGSIYGQVEATTPLVDGPLTGNVFLRSNPEHKLPDLVLALKGPPSLPVEIDTAGRIDSVNGGIRTTFENIPDAPIGKVTLAMQGGSKGLLVNSRNLCGKGSGRMTVRFVGQNNKRADQFPALGNSCKKARKHKRAHHRRR